VAEVERQCRYGKDVSRCPTSQGRRLLTLIQGPKKARWRFSTARVKVVALQVGLRRILPWEVGRENKELGPASRRKAEIESTPASAQFPTANQVRLRIFNIKWINVRISPKAVSLILDQLCRSMFS
jgi:hypothetical protein